MPEIVPLPSPQPTPPPAAGAILPQWAVVALTALVGVAGVVLTIGETGITLPPWAHSVAVAVVGIGAMFGVISPGVRRPVPPAPVQTLEQAAEVLRRGPNP